MTHIIVQQRIGEFSMPECTIDMFEAGILTISSTRTGEIVQTCYPGEWESATVYDEKGYPVFGFTSEAVQARGRAALALVVSR
jgi:hypothetical protein